MRKDAKHDSHVRAKSSTAKQKTVTSVLKKSDAPGIKKSATTASKTQTPRTATNSPRIPTTTSRPPTRHTSAPHQQQGYQESMPTLILELPSELWEQIMHDLSPSGMHTRRADAQEQSALLTTHMHERTHARTPLQTPSPTNYTYHTRTLPFFPPFVHFTDVSNVSLTCKQLHKQCTTATPTTAALWKEVRNVVPFCLVVCVIVIGLLVLLL